MSNGRKSLVLCSYSRANWADISELQSNPFGDKYPEIPIFHRFIRD